MLDCILVHSAHGLDMCMDSKAFRLVVLDVSCMVAHPFMVLLQSLERCPLATQATPVRVVI